MTTTTATPTMDDNDRDKLETIKNRHHQPASLPRRDDERRRTLSGFFFSLLFQPHHDHDHNYHDDDKTKAGGTGDGHSAVQRGKQKNGSRDVTTTSLGP